MSLKALLSSEVTRSLRRHRIFLRKSYATTANSAKEEVLDITSVDTQPKFEVDGPPSKEDHAAPDRNKSRLNPQHYNIMKGRRPYKEEGVAYHHYSIEWKRKLLGRYGIEGSNVPPGVAWPTKEAIAEAKEYEKVAYPMSLQDSWAQIAAVKAEEAAKLQARQDELAAKSAMTSRWEKELYAKLAKKEAEVRAAKQRKERMMEEIRRHFGFKVDPRDERFQEMMEQKEKEDKKRRKDAKKKERAEKLMAKLLEDSNAAPTGDETAKDANSPKSQDLA